jgi:hypothetical protein
MAKNILDPIGTLSVGNVVTTGTILYKSNFKRYFQISLRATGWWLAIIVATFGLIMSGSLLFFATRSWWGIVPFTLAWIALNIYFLAKYATDRAIICRLAYQELINAPETVDAATRQLLPNMWGFLRISLLVGLYLLIIGAIGYIAIAIIAGFAVYSFTSQILSIGSNFWIYTVMGLSILGLVLTWIAIIMRYYATWFVAELPLAIESTRSANFSIRRSRRLCGVAIRRIVTIITIAFIITLPINIITSVPSFIGQIMTSPVTSPDPSTQLIGGGLVLVGILLSLIVELFLMPLWQAVKAVVYYDLRNRFEGSDLVIEPGRI